MSVPADPRHPPNGKLVASGLFYKINNNDQGNKTLVHKINIYVIQKGSLDRFYAISEDKRKNHPDQGNTSEDTSKGTLFEVIGTINSRFTPENRYGLGNIFKGAGYEPFHGLVWRYAPSFWDGKHDFVLSKLLLTHPRMEETVVDPRHPPNGKLVASGLFYKINDQGKTLPAGDEDGLYKINIS